MDKIILIDGNNLLFRSYYATAYNGNFMKNSKGFPTNGLFGFTNMINKILLEEKPQYIMVAFDKGKTFRHEKYESYKGGRLETPIELKQQFPIAKQLLTSMGITYYEIDNYEADDIIGTFAKYCDDDPTVVGTIISSDKDLLQLLSDDVDIKLLKQKDYIRYNKDTFTEEYGIEPKRVVDLKALMGDASDNIPGVKGIGEKTALKLLQQYKTLDGVYEHLEEISGTVQVKLKMDKENAYMSYELATIYKDVPMEIAIPDIRYRGIDHVSLNALYEELEFFSFLKKDAPKEPIKPELAVQIIRDSKDLHITSPVAVYLEILGSNYHTAKILGMGIYNEDICAYLPLEVLKQNPQFLEQIPKYTFDLKKVYTALKWQGISIKNVEFDVLLAAYLLDYNVKDDISYLANQMDYMIPFYDATYGKGAKLEEVSEDVIAYETTLKAHFIYENYQSFQEKLEKENMMELYKTIEHPLSTVLGDMEYNGVYVDEKSLDEMGEEIKIKLELISNEIYNHAGCVFNISSPSQLGEILFDKLGLPHGKKGKTGYSTAADVLSKLRYKHPIIELTMEHRSLTKLLTTYIDGLKNTIMKDHKIHTIYTQTLTRTGRLSSIEPNLQNIPARYEYGRLIRKAFIPSPDSLIIGSDYSQIELRILAHMADVGNLITAFREGRDIHTKTASDIFHVEEQQVTSSMRRMAKAVNFGIIYGISSYGLSENVGITPKEAKAFIDEYLETYPGIKSYMDKTIEQAHKDGYVTTLFHRKRIIPELENKNYMIRNGGERMALNTPIQGTAADVIKKAMVDVDKKFKEMNLQSKMILQVHDELVFDCLKSEFDIVISIVKEVMEGVCTLEVPLQVDIHYGDNWYQAK